MSRSEVSGPAEQAAADVARLLSRARGLRRVVELAAAALDDEATDGDRTQDREPDAAA